MKRILLSLFLINLILVSKAQKAKIEYGFQSGINISTVYGNGVFGDYRSPLTGFHIGGHLKVSKTENWGLKFIISYDNIGWIYKSLTIENSAGTGVMNADISIKLNYLNIPVLAEYSFGKKVKINIDGGGFLGILLNNKIVTDLNPPIPPGEEASTQTSGDNRKSTNLGLSLGTGIQIPLASKLKLDFNFRDNLGLTNIIKSQSADARETKTNSFTISAGLTFKL